MNGVAGKHFTAHFNVKYLLIAINFSFKIWFYTSRFSDISFFENMELTIIGMLPFKFVKKLQTLKMYNVKNKWKCNKTYHLKKYMQVLKYFPRKSAFYFPLKEPLSTSIYYIMNIVYILHCSIYYTIIIINILCSLCSRKYIIVYMYL